MRKALIALLLLMATPTAPSNIGTMHAQCLQPENICIITSPNVTTKQLSFEDLYSIYTLFIRHWDSGDGITVAVLRSSDTTHREFINSVLGTTVSRYERDINAKIFGGRVLRKPVRFSSEFELVQYVAEHENIIGYVSHEALDDFEISSGGYSDTNVISIK
jgi:ABC-type phosphate transport system substrate-binding protein